MTSSYNSYLPGSDYDVDDPYPYTPSDDREELMRRQILQDKRRQLGVDREEALMGAQQTAAEEGQENMSRPHPPLRQTSKVCLVNRDRCTTF